MADIEKQGGKIKLTAETLPTGHTISVGNLPSWITVDSTSTSQKWVGKVSQNEDADDRSYTLTGTVTTNTDPAYEGTTSQTKTWQVTQEGTGSTPPPPIVTNKTIEVNVEYEGDIDVSEVFPSIEIRVPNVSPENWTPNNYYATTSYTFDVGRITESSLFVSAKSDVPPYLHRLWGRIEGPGGPTENSDYDYYGGRPLYIDLSVNFEFNSDVASFGVRISGTERA